MNDSYNELFNSGVVGGGGLLALHNVGINEILVETFRECLFITDTRKTFFLCVLRTDFGYIFISLRYSSAPVMGALSCDHGPNTLDMRSCENNNQ